MSRGAVDQRARLQSEPSQGSIPCPGALALQVPLWGSDGAADFPRGSALDRFFMKVEIGDCWLWVGATDRGYGKFYPHGKTVRAHRWLYEQLVGPVPRGMDLDHLCRVRACVNPDHLEVVTRKVNLARSPLTANGRSPAQTPSTAGGRGSLAVAGASEEVTASRAMHTCDRVGMTARRGDRPPR